MLQINSISENIKALNIEINEEIKLKIKSLYVFRDYFNKINSILVTNQDEVYCFGNNSCGVLGFGHENKIEDFSLNENLSNKQIIDLKQSLFHTIACDSEGKLYCWGNNDCLGNGRHDDEISKPELNKYLIDEHIVEMRCGYCHTLVLTSNNEVYAWGWNRAGQIGNGSDDDYVVIPSKINEFNGEKVESISCGLEHSMALTENGCVFIWGQNCFGQLGLNNENQNVNKPERIQTEIEIRKISCGRDHCLLLSCVGDIYVFGTNNNHQLGIETNGLTQSIPKKLNHSEKFIEIAAHYCYDISAALSEKNLYYVWGKCGNEGIISYPKETKFKSFEEIFITIDNNSIVKTGKYAKNWIEMIELGEGSYGKVFKVKQKLENKIFALKKIVLFEVNTAVEDTYKELQNSFHFLKLDNEFLVKYYDIWAEHDSRQTNDSNNSTLYIQMDLCDKTLFDIKAEIKEDSKLFSNNSFTQLGYYVLSELFIQILKGVKYLHNNEHRSIIHRDLHPGNILAKISANGNCIKIADFGLAKVHEIHNTKVNTGDIGNITYSAPEVLDCEYYDIKADIYSLGVILEELFEIESNSDYMENENLTSLLKSKYENAKNLSFEMKNEDYKERPNCEQILDRREMWAINESEFNFKEELNIFSMIEDRNYVQNMMVSKLLYILDKFSLSF